MNIKGEYIVNIDIETVKFIEMLNRFADAAKKPNCLIPCSKINQDFISNIIKDPDYWRNYILYKDIEEDKEWCGSCKKYSVITDVSFENDDATLTLVEHESAKIHILGDKWFIYFGLKDNNGNLTEFYIDKNGWRCYPSF